MTQRESQRIGCIVYDNIYSTKLLDTSVDEVIYGCKVSYMRRHTNSFSVGRSDVPQHVSMHLLFGWRS